MQTTIEGTEIKGYSPVGVKGYPYLIPCTYIAKRRAKDGLLTWRATGVVTRTVRSKGGVPSDWIRSGTKRQDASRAVGIHGKVCP